MNDIALERIIHLLSFSDSQFPVGNFSFSNGLEAAAISGIVHDADTLRQYAEAASIQSAFSDGIASIQAWRGASRGDYATILKADSEVILCKMNEEARRMVCRMGKKLAELCGKIMHSDLMERFLNDMNTGKTPGTYPIAQAIAFQSCGIGEREMFASQQFGVINMILGAALRLIRVSHYDTQKIMFDLATRVADDYEKIRTMDFEDMRAFVPGIDMMASFHEKGPTRMFMN